MNFGRYTSQHYITVIDKESSKRLQFLGNFGTYLENASRKPVERRGPADRWLLESKLDGELALTLAEAFYLTYSLGILKVVNDKTGNQMTLLECWSEFRNLCKLSRKRLDFAMEYAVYHYFKSRDWVIKTGHNYGTNYLLYREGPAIDHARYAVHIINDEFPPEWESLLTLYRVLQSVCKKLLLVFVHCATTNFDSPKCIEGIKITIRAFESKTIIKL